MKLTYERLKKAMMSLLLYSQGLSLCWNLLMDLLLQRGSASLFGLFEF